MNATVEDRELDYRFRRHESFAIGHGVAATWDDARPVRRIATDAVPTQTVPPVRARESSDIALDMVTSRTFDNRIQLLEYAPRVLDGPPGGGAETTR